MTAESSDGAAHIRSLRIERTGGLAGLPVSVEVDGASLTAAQQKALDKVSQAVQKDLAAAPAAVARGADRFRYRLHVVQSDGQQRVIDVSEDDMPQALGVLAKPGLP